MVKLVVIHYSATGHRTRMAEVIEQAAQAAGAEVRVRHVVETNPVERLQDNPAWKANYDATKDLPAATADDIIWADAVILGSPTRFSNVAAPLQAFLNSLGGPWSQCTLADTVYAAHTSTNTPPRWPGDDTAEDLAGGAALRRHHRRPRCHRPEHVRRRQPLRRQLRHRSGQPERARRDHPRGPRAHDPVPAGRRREARRLAGPRAGRPRHPRGGGTKAGPPAFGWR